MLVYADLGVHSVPQQPCIAAEVQSNCLLLVVTTIIFPMIPIRMIDAAVVSFVLIAAKLNHARIVMGIV
jgi:hypothetical protein